MKKNDYNNNKIILDLISKFDYLQQRYIEDQEFYYGLPHLFYSFEVYAYAKKLLVDNDKSNLDKLLNFMEDELKKEDPYIENVIAVSFLENLIYDSEIIFEKMSVLLPTLMKKTLLDMKNWSVL